MTEDREYDDILREEAALERALEDLRQRKALLAENSDPQAIRTHVAPKARRGVREVVLDSLHVLKCLSYSQHIAGFARAVYGREIAATRFGTLSRDEEHAFERAIQSGARRPVWLCHALTYDRGEPIRRLWARSDWALEDRVVGPLTGRVIYLRLTARLAELAGRLESAADPDLLRYITADAARDLMPGFKRGEFPVSQWRDVALKQLSEVEEEDASIRKQSAKRLTSKLRPEQLLFGRKGDLTVLRGGRAETGGV
jgi:hypothetical protein